MEILNIFVIFGIACGTAIPTLEGSGDHQILKEEDPNRFFSLDAELEGIKWKNLNYISVKSLEVEEFLDDGEGDNLDSLGEDSDGEEDRNKHHHKHESHEHRHDKACAVS